MERICAVNEIHLVNNLEQQIVAGRNDNSKSLDLRDSQIESGAGSDDPERGSAA